MPKQRLIRVLVYEGSPEFIQNIMSGRGVKGSYRTPHGQIKEAIIGDFLEEVFERVIPEEPSNA